MGPNLLIDKSTIQSLPHEEIVFLYKHYSVILPPVLIVEVIADYSKYKDATEASNRVGVLASKLDDYVNIDYRHLVIKELTGARFPMDGRPIVEPTGVGYTNNGKKFVLVEESPWQIAARHWQEGNFTPEDIKFAQIYRSQRDAISVAELAQELAKDAVLPKFKNLDEVVQFILKALAHPNPSFQTEGILAWLNFLGVYEGFKKQVIKRWEQAGKPLFSRFLPYGFYCYSILSVVAVAMTQKLVPTGKSSHLFVDLEYLFYLPFCQVFCSSDRFHQSLAPYFMKTRQVLINGQDLKEDLRNIAKHWNGLQEDERSQFAINNRHRPPRLDSSPTSRCWDLFMNPDYPKAKADIQLTEDKKRKILEKIKTGLASAKENKRTIEGPEYQLYTKDNGQDK